MELITKISSLPELELNRPPTVHSPPDEHDRSLMEPGRRLLPDPVAYTTGRAVLQTPFTDVVVKASSAPSVFRKKPIAVHEPGEPQETLDRDVVVEFCTTAGKETNCVCPQTPFTDASLIAYVLPSAYTSPTATQLPVDMHDTEWSPEAVSNAWAVDHTPLLDDTVKPR